MSQHQIFPIWKLKPNRSPFQYDQWLSFLASLARWFLSRRILPKNCIKVFSALQNLLPGKWSRCCPKLSFTTKFISIKPKWVVFKQESAMTHITSLATITKSKWTCIAMAIRTSGFTRCDRPKHIGPVRWSETWLKLAKKHYSSWIVVREKHCSSWKKKPNKPNMG